MKKNINIILILAVLGLWGTVVFKYVKHFFQEEPSTLAGTSISNVMLPKAIQKDTFALTALSVDPFLKKSYSPAPTPPVAVVAPTIHPTPKKAPKKVLPPVVKEVTPFPEIHYYGFIKSSDKADELILIKVNRSLYKTRLNAECQGVVIKKVYRDSIEVKFDNRKATIHKL